MKDNTMELIVKVLGVFILSAIILGIPILVVLNYIFQWSIPLHILLVFLFIGDFYFVSTLIIERILKND